MNVLSEKALKKPEGGGFNSQALGLFLFEGIFVGLYPGEGLYIRDILKRNFRSVKKHTIWDRKAYV